MKVKLLGTGNAFSSEKNNTSFILHLNSPVMVDCPKNVFQVFKKARLSPGTIGDIIITHCHADHLGDLSSLLLYRRIILGKVTKIYATTGVIEDIKAILGPTHNRFIDNDSKNRHLDYFCMFVPLNSQTRIAGATIIAKSNVHPVPTFGFKVTFRNKVFVYAGDTDIDKENIKKYVRFLSGADLILHEAVHSDDRVHTKISSLRDLPKKIREKINLVHIPDGFEASDFKIPADFDVLNA